jgi:hypothetical protein
MNGSHDAECEILIVQSQARLWSDLLQQVLRVRFGRHAVCQVSKFAPEKNSYDAHWVIWFLDSQTDLDTVLQSLPYALQVNIVLLTNQGNMHIHWRESINADCSNISLRELLGVLEMPVEQWHNEKNLVPRRSYASDSE